MAKTMTAVEDTFENCRWDDVARRYVETGDAVSMPEIKWAMKDGIVAYNDNQRRPSSWMQTFTGKKFWPLAPSAKEVDIHDIAHSLSMMCRYGGHVLRFYSVAEHSVHIANWLRARGYAPNVALAGLLHDATEAYLVDVPRPLKRNLVGYKEAEASVWCAIAERFDLPEEIPDAVHEADNRILGDEIHQNMRPMDWHAEHNSPLGVTLQFWTPERAETEFWRAYYQVQCERQENRRCEIERAA